MLRGEASAEDENSGSSCCAGRSITEDEKHEDVVPVVPMSPGGSDV